MDGEERLMQAFQQFDEVKNTAQREALRAQEGGRIEGHLHFVICPDCDGTGRHVWVFDGGQEERDRGPCESCDGRGSHLVKVSAEDCDCEQCAHGFWFWPANDAPAQRFERLSDALRAGAGEITKRELREGRVLVHVRVATQG